MPLFAETNWPMYIFAFGCAMAIGILLRRSRKYYSTFAKWQRDRRVAPQLPEPRPAPPTNVDKPVSMQHWELEMHEHVREMSAILDSKMIALQHLVHDADEAVARLEAAMARVANVERGLDGKIATIMKTKSEKQATIPVSATPIAVGMPLASLPPTYPPDAFHGAYQGESG